MYDVSMASRCWMGTGILLDPDRVLRPTWSGLTKPDLRDCPGAEACEGVGGREPDW